jgi:hypothetical protein
MKLHRRRIGQPEPLPRLMRKAAPFSGRGDDHHPDLFGLLFLEPERDMHFRIER